ncbi:MAG: DNRLRE domain-containing protein [Actinobacteria bacterium]|nr:DNRLRE domain-containing protein [Actinomycetota bacterium]
MVGSRGLRFGRLVALTVALALLVPLVPAVAVEAPSDPDGPVDVEVSEPVESLTGEEPVDDVPSGRETPTAPLETPDAPTSETSEPDDTSGTTVPEVPLAVEVPADDLREGEVAELRTRTSHTVRRDDGQLDTQVVDGPVHFRDQQGAWRRIRSELVPEAVAPGAGWRNAANDFAVRFNPQMTQRFAQLTDRAGARWWWTLQGATDVTGTVEGATITYPGVFPQVDAAYTSLATGVKETLTLHGPQAPSTFTTRIDTAGEDWRAAELEGGSWAFYRAPATDAVFTLSPPLVFEQQAGVAGEDPHATLDVEPVEGGYDLTVTVDPAWLAAPGRNWPVVVDPVVDVGDPTKDAYFIASCSTCTARVGFELPVGTTDETVYRSAVAFDLSGIATGSDITSASLQLYYDGGCLPLTDITLSDPSSTSQTSSSGATATCGLEDHVLTVHELSQSWSETSTSAAVSSFGFSQASATVPAVGTRGWVSWGVTSSVEDWYLGLDLSNDGMLIKRSSEGPRKGGPKFVSRNTADASKRPQLLVTWVESVTLDEPATLRSNGAELTWSKFLGTQGDGFASYEVHRSCRLCSGSFFPSSSTQLAVIEDADTTSFTDTTAGPGQFPYQVKVIKASGAHATSNPRTVTLPAIGQVQQTLRPDPVAGTATQITGYDSAPVCVNHGASSRMLVGARADATTRALLQFDLSHIASDAQITSAQLGLEHDPVSTGQTISVHPATAAWVEGSGDGTCSGDGATWHDRREGAVTWETDGGDLDSTAASSLSNAAGDVATDTFNLAGLVEQWVAGTRPNHGLVLSSSLGLPGTDTAISYLTDDETASWGKRPTLQLTYIDGSAPIAPRLTLTGVDEGGTVRGQVTLHADATDDRRVKLVHFYLNDSYIGSDTSTPFDLAWNSTTFPNTTETHGEAGAHEEFKAVAVDDAGNATTARGAKVRVANSTPPTASITAPLQDATVAGDVTVSATVAANAPAWLTRAELWVDGWRVAERSWTAGDTVPPSVEFSWPTLTGSRRFYDGVHELTVKVFDSETGTGTSQTRTVTVNNRAVSRYYGDISAPHMPTDLLYDPDINPQLSYTFDATVTNNGPLDWGTILGEIYHLEANWIDSAGSVVDVSSASLPRLRSGESVTVPMTVRPPSLPAATHRATYTLQLDIVETLDLSGHDAPTIVTFSSRGNTPKSGNATVTKAEFARQLGLENHLHYVGEALGGGMSHLVNVATGNSLVSFTPFSAPGTGLNTVVDLAYNSLEASSRSPVGHGWSLNISGMQRLGEPLELHPNDADKNAGRNDRTIAFTDGDGTVHHFTGTTASNDADVVWTEPAGVDLYLRTYQGPDASDTRYWAITRPDRVTFLFNREGWPTAVRDGNGNTLTYEYVDPDPDVADDVGWPRKQLHRVIDAAGRSFTLTYYTAADAPHAQIRGLVKAITDHDGSRLEFTYYYHDGNLRTITQVGNSGTQPRLPADDRTWTFTYTTSSLNGPAIPGVADRRDPDPGTSPQSTALYSVIDPRDGETIFAYHTSGRDKRRLASRTDRAKLVETYTYAEETRRVTVTAPENRVTVYSTDAHGRMVQLEDPLNRITGVSWSADHKVIKVTEPTEEFTTYAYNANGLPTSVEDQLGNKTVLEYTDRAVADHTTDTRDTRSHISDLEAVTRPEGVKTTGIDNDHRYTFGIDPATGNVLSATVPGEPGKFHTTTFTYNSNGTLASRTDPNNHTTTFPSYHKSGQPIKITNPLGRSTLLSYDDDGLLTAIQEPIHATKTGTPTANYQTQLHYDRFHRLVRTSTPKHYATKRGVLVWNGVAFDPNDNVEATFEPAYGADYTAGPATGTVFDAMDRPVTVTEPDDNDTADTSDDHVTRLEYDEAGRVEAVTSPRGTATARTDDFRTEYTYDALDRVVRQRRLDVDQETGTVNDPADTHFCYDLAGDLVWQVAPNAKLLATVDCTATSPPSHTTVRSYDDAHRLISVTDAEDHTTSFGYNANDELTSRTDAEGVTTTIDYDQRGLPVTVTEPFQVDASGASLRDAVSRHIYDPVGNLETVVSPRGWDASTDKVSFTHYVTRYTYDAADRLTRVALPTDATTAASFVHRRYDDNGRLTASTLPVADAVLPSGGSLPQGTTVVGYYDTDWVRLLDTAHVPGATPALFDYDAAGRQALRVGQREASWSYTARGLLRERHDRDEQVSRFDYDADRNLVKALEGGVEATGIDPTLVCSSYDGRDRPSQVTSGTPAASDEPGVVTCNFTGGTDLTTLDYDLDGNVTQRILDDATSPARMQTLTYDQIGWPATFTDTGPDGLGSTTDDLGIDHDFDDVGREKQRILKRFDGTALIPHQTTTWSWHGNGLLDQLTTTVGTDVVERHTVGYLDTAGRFVNGHRTSDTFHRAAPDTAVPCQSPTSPCTATYRYDARGRLVLETDGHGGTISYQPDLIGNIERIVDDTSGTAVTVLMQYQGVQLEHVQVDGGAPIYHHYDGDGNLACTTSVDDASLCHQTASGKRASDGLVAAYVYDRLDRLVATRTVHPDTGNGASVDDTATFLHDALDRLVTIEETHSPPASAPSWPVCCEPSDGGSTRLTDLAYVALTDLVAKETLDTHRYVGGFVGVERERRNRVYSYDAVGNRLGLDIDSTLDSRTPEGSFTFAHDVHGSTSLLLDDLGAPAASYGYRAYGAPDPALTAGNHLDIDPDTDAIEDLVNPFTYTGKRFDTGANHLDMGARQFSPNTTRFLQDDIFNNALTDLNTSLDPLTGNRYALAGGNPLSFVELDGRRVTENGDGGSITYEPTRMFRRTPPSTVATQSKRGFVPEFTAGSYCASEFGATTNEGIACLQAAEAIGEAADFFLTAAAVAEGVRAAGDTVLSVLPGGDCVRFAGDRDATSLGFCLADAPGGPLDEIVGAVAGGIRRMVDETGSVRRAAGFLGHSLDDLSAAASRAGPGELTLAGHSLSKHAARQRSASKLFPPLRGGPGEINRLAQFQVDDILTHPGSRAVRGHRGRFGATIEVISPDGRGLVYSGSGNFLFFAEFP